MKKYVQVYTKQFRRDLKRLKRSGYDLGTLEKVIDILASGSKPEEKYHDHSLKGAMRNTRECHISPDWLLVYMKDDDDLILLLVRTGTHRDVWGIE